MAAPVSRQVAADAVAQIRQQIFADTKVRVKDGVSRGCRSADRLCRFTVNIPNRRVERWAEKIVGGQDWAEKMEKTLSPKLDAAMVSKIVDNPTKADYNGDIGGLLMRLRPDDTLFYDNEVDDIDELYVFAHEGQRAIRDEYIQTHLPFFYHAELPDAAIGSPVINSSLDNVVVVSAKVPAGGEVHAHQLVFRHNLTGDIVMTGLTGVGRVPYRRAYTIGVTLSAGKAGERVGVAVRGCVPVVFPYSVAGREKMGEGMKLRAGYNWAGVDTTALVAIVRSHANERQFEQSLQGLAEAVYGGEAGEFTECVNRDLDNQVMDGSIVYNFVGTEKPHFLCTGPNGKSAIYTPLLEKYDSQHHSTPAWQIVTLAKLYHDENYLEVILP